MLLLLACEQGGAEAGTAASAAAGEAGAGQPHELRLTNRRSRPADIYAHRKLALRLALVDAPAWRHVGIVPPDGGCDMPLAREGVVGRVDADPSCRGQEHLQPGVRGVGIGTVSTLPGR